MTLDEFFRDQLSRGQPPLVALHNTAQAYAAALKQRDCSQYADETEAWSGPEEDEPQDSEAVELLREEYRRVKKWMDNGVSITDEEASWHERVRKFLEEKQ